MAPGRLALSVPGVVLAHKASGNWPVSGVSDIMKKKVDVRQIQSTGKEPGRKEAFV
jgi:hypothetical protein